MGSSTPHPHPHDALSRWRWALRAPCWVRWSSLCPWPISPTITIRMDGAHSLSLFFSLVVKNSWVVPRQKSFTLIGLKCNPWIPMVHILSCVWMCLTSPSPRSPCRSIHEAQTHPAPGYPQIYLWSHQSDHRHFLCRIQPAFFASEHPEGDHQIRLIFPPLRSWCFSTSMRPPTRPGYWHIGSPKIEGKSLFILVYHNFSTWRCGNLESLVGKPVWVEVNMFETQTGFFWHTNWLTSCGG